jgi:hypothetical protein
LWDAHLRGPAATPYLVYRAARFFLPYDKPRAEQLILRGMEIDPQSEALRSRMPPDVGGYSWPAQLAQLYAAALAGARGISIDESSADLARSPFAQEVRRKLDASRDANLLASVGSQLVTLSRYRRSPAEDLAALGRSYVQRAAELAPASDTVRRIVDNLDARDRLQRTARAIREGRGVNDEDRLEYLALNAQEAYSLAEFQTDYRKDAAAAQRKIDEARKGAEEILTTAGRVPPSPRVGGAVMAAHQTLALIALRDGSRSQAVEHMRRSVAEYFERYAQLAPWRKEMLVREAAAIRDGRMPETYQRMFARPGERR